MFYNLQIHKFYNFTLLAPAILGAEYRNARVMGIIDYDTAKSIQDVVPLHTAAYPYLAVGTPRKVEDLTFIKIKTNIGDIRVIAMEWLANEPQLNAKSNLRVTLSEVEPDKEIILRDILAQNGFTSFTIETI